MSFDEEEKPYPKNEHRLVSMNRNVEDLVFRQGVLEPNNVWYQLFDCWVNQQYQIQLHV